MYQHKAIYQPLHSHCEQRERAKFPGTAVKAGFTDLEGTLKLNYEWIHNLIVGFMSPICVRAHASSDSQRSSPDWMVYPFRTISTWPLGSMIGVFANQEWQSDYTSGLGNKKPLRNLGVTLRQRSPLEKYFAQCQVGCIHVTLYPYRHLKEGWYKKIIGRPLFH